MIEFNIEFPLFSYVAYLREFHIPSLDNLIT